MIVKAKQYAESRRGQWDKLAKEADVSYGWLCKFMQDQIPDPSYFRVERLYALASKADRKRARKSNS